MEPKRLVLIENESQAREYLKNIGDFKDYLPITFTYPAEKLLKKTGIKFKTEEDYEKAGIYKGIHAFSIRSTWEICKNFKLTYREIEIPSLFYYNIYAIIAAAKKNLRLLKEIIKTEKPDEITVFQSDKFYEDENFSRIIKSCFGGKTNFRHFFRDKKKDVREKFIFKIFSRFRKFRTLMRLNIAGRKRRIFMFGGQIYFGNLAEELSKDKRNYLVNFGDKLRKSFSIRSGSLPFYEFIGKKNQLQKNLSEELNSLQELWSKKDFSGFGLETEIGNFVRENIFLMMSKELFPLMEKLEEAYHLFKNKKTDLLLLSEESSPFTRGIVQYARTFKIPTMQFQHGMFITEISSYSNADFVFCMDGDQKKSYKRASSKLTNLEVLGIPRYDSLIPNPDKKEKIILYLMEIAASSDLVPDTHLTKKRQKELLRKIFSVMKNFPDYKLIIKTRPYWEMASLPEDIAKEEGFTNFEVIERTDNVALLNRSSLAIINFTTMGIEALMLGKPVISLSYHDLDKYNPYLKIPLIPKVYDEKNLKKKMGEFLKKNGKMDASEVLDHLGLVKDSSKRIAEFIKGVLDKESRY